MREWIFLVLLAAVWMAITAVFGAYLFSRFPGARQVAVSPRTTAIVVAAIIPCLGLLDVLFAWVGGNEATISAVNLAIRVKFPLVAKSVGYCFGLYLGHVYFPSAEPVAPPFHEVLARLLSGLGPFWYAIVLIASGDGEAANADVTGGQAQLIFAAEMLLWLVVGGIVGRFWLSQHPLALAGVPT